MFALEAAEMEPCVNITKPIAESWGGLQEI